MTKWPGWGINLVWMEIMGFILKKLKLYYLISLDQWAGRKKKQVKVKLHIVSCYDIVL